MAQIIITEGGSAGTPPTGTLSLYAKTDDKLYTKNSAGVESLVDTSTSAGTVQSVSVTSANGFAGTVATATTTPAITLSTSVTGVLKGNGTAISAATPSTDYAVPTVGSSVLYGNGLGGFSNVTIGTGLSFAGGTLTNTVAAGTGTVTNTAGNLTASAVMVGNGTVDAKVLGSLGTTTTVLHGNAAGLPTWGSVALGTDVSGTLPIASGGTNGTSFLAPAGGVNPLIFYDGTRLNTNSVVNDIGYNPSTNTLYTSTLNISNALTTVATFTNTGVQGATAGAGMIGYSDPGAAILSGNRLGFFLMGGSIDAAHTLVNPTGFAGMATENFSATNQGASCVVYTTPNGSTTAARRTVATFGQDGTFSVLNGVSGTQFTSTIATGTAPLVVTSTTNVANLNASSLNGATFAAPGAIGGGTAAAGTFTAIVGTSYNGNTITTGTGTLTLAASSTLATSGAFSATITSTATSNATLPAGTNTLQSALRTINAQTGTTYTFVLGDGSQNGLNTLCSFGNAAAITVTVPTNASVAFPVGTQIDCIQDGAGKVTFAAAGGVTINSLASNKSIAGQYVGVTLIKEATDTWYLIGNLIA